MSDSDGNVCPGEMCVVAWKPGREDFQNVGVFEEAEGKREVDGWQQYLGQAGLGQEGKTNSPFLR